MRKRGERGTERLRERLLLTCKISPFLVYPALDPHLSSVPTKPYFPSCCPYLALLML